MTSLTLALLLSAPVHATSGGLPRFPDIGHGQVVFTAGGDLWKVPVSGGVARQLTTHPGQERFAHISPDGKWIAYTAEYQGESDVWVMPFEGGAPKRLTWHSGGNMDDVVFDWTPDSQSVLFGSAFESPNSRFKQLYRVSIEGGLPIPYPTSDIGPMQLLPDGKSYVFNRIFRNFRTWKRYSGGSQQDLWLWDDSAKASKRLTSWAGTDTLPMVGSDGTIYFVSDRPELEGGYSRRNLFVYTSDGHATALTHHTDFDVDWPAIDGDTIVYMLGGDLRLHNLTVHTDTQLKITIPDEALKTQPEKQQFSGSASAWSPGPQGKRVAVIKHGDLFSVPAKDGDWRAVHATSDDRVYDVEWSPDGKTLAMVTDKENAQGTTEQEIWLIDQAGAEPPKQLTKGNTTWITGIAWSSNSRRILHTDKRMRLWDVDVISGLRTLVDTGESDAIHDAVYSPDGTWIAYVKPGDNDYGNLWLFKVTTGTKTQITDDFNDDFSPCWGPESKVLYFASRRNFDQITNTFELRMVHRRTDEIYAIRLTKDGDDPLEPKSDEEVDDKGDPDFDKDEDESKRAKRKERRRKKKVVLDPDTTRVDLDDIAQRVQRLPISPGRYHSLTANEDGLFYQSEWATGDSPGEIWMWDFEDQSDDFVIGGVRAFTMAAGGDKLLYVDRMGELNIASAEADAAMGDMLQTWDLAAWVDPKVEWAHTLDEVYRYLREYFYDPNMHGHDWEGITASYSALLDRATASDDVIWLIGEMIGELNVGHAYVFGGWDGLWDVRTGSLGAKLTDDGQGIKVSYIYNGEPGDPQRTSPLRAPGVEISEGDYLVAIDGHELHSGENPNKWLVDSWRQRIQIEVNSRPSRDGARSYQVQPMLFDNDLRYWDWVQGRKAYVAERTDGRVAYVHIPDTAEDGYTEFVRGIYADHDKDALILDERFNSGGYIPEMFIEHLLRPLYNIWVPRDGSNWRTPQIAIHGPKAMLINGYAGSGGDALPYYFKQFELGPVVGTHTWGGLVGISGAYDLLIGGAVTAPSFAFVNRDGEWDVEHKGVAPTIEVVNPPEATRKGEDPQLDAAIDAILQALESWKDPVPDRPSSFPVRR